MAGHPTSFPRRGGCGGAPHLIPEEGNGGTGVHRVEKKRAGKTAIDGKWTNLPSLMAGLHL